MFQKGPPPGTSKLALVTIVEINGSSDLFVGSEDPVSILFLSDGYWLKVTLIGECSKLVVVWGPVGLLKSS